jgi:Leucine Rich repeat
MRGCCRLGGAGFDALRGAPRLRQLDLAGCAALNHGGAACLARMTSLTSLNLRHCERVDDAFMAQVRPHA